MANQADVRKIDNKIEADQTKQNRTNDRTIDGTFSRTKYDVSELVYPSDLLSNDSRYGNNYVVFYINVTEAARTQDAYGNNLGGEDYVPDFDKRVTTSIQESNLGMLGATAGIAGQNAIAGAGLGAIGASLRGNFSGALKGAGVGTLLAAVPVATLAVSGVQFQRGRKRLKRAIMMNMPNSFKTNYNMIYGVADLKNFSLAAVGVDTLYEAGKDLLVDGDKQGAIDKIKSLNGAAASLALSSPNTDGIQAMTGVQANPKSEVLFNGVNFRSFALAYQFFPRNKDEQDKVEDIIREFKYHMHPEYMDEKKFVYIYPSEFDISFYHKDQENEHLPKIASCALVDMLIDYTPQGVWVANTDGSPSQINVTLQFKELATLSKDAIQKGY